MKLELDLNSSQKTTLINNPVNDLGAEDVKKMLRSGINFAKEGNRVEARQMLLGVTEIEPDNETAWLWLASISEYPEELLVFLQNVLRINPNNERALEWAKQTKSLLSKTFVQRGINATQNNQKDFAKQCFLQGIVHDSENEMAWLWLASTSESQEEKVSHLSQVLRINPQNETALSSLNAVKNQMSQGLLKKASSAAIAGDHETARQALNSIMKNSPNLEEAWILKAFLATDFYEKIDCYEKALGINPTSEAAQAGLASLKLLMPTMPKPAVVEEKAEESPAAQEPVKEEVQESVKEEIAEPVKEEVPSAPVVIREEVIEEFAKEPEQDPIQFDESFDLEQLVNDPVVEQAEIAQPIAEVQAQPESRAFAEEVFYEKQQEEAAIHETQTAVKENYAQPVAEQPRVESIFNFEEVVAQEENQTESVLEFDEVSDHPTQELDEDFADNAAAAFNIAVEEEATLETASVEETKEAVESAPELEDFYTEQVSEEVPQNVAAEEQVAVAPKAEVKITETYIAEVNPPQIYDSEFYANDGFVLVPQNDPFADYLQETVEFSYTESEGVQAAAEKKEVAEKAEEQQSATVGQISVSHEVEQVAETAPVAEEVLQPEQVHEDEQIVEPQAEVQQYVEPQQVEENVAHQESLHFEENQPEPSAENLYTEQTEKISESEFAEHVEEFKSYREEQPVEQTLESRQFEQTEETEQVSEVEQVVETTQFEQEIAEPQQAEFSEETAELQQAETTEEVEQLQTEEVEQLARTEEVVEEIAQPEPAVELAETENSEQLAESYETENFAEAEQAVESAVEPEKAEQKEEYAQLVSEIQSLGSQAALTQCPFCAAENESQVVCGSCQAMLSLADMESLISHQGVNQDLLLQAVERMEVEKSLREFNAEELTYLAIAHLNAKNLEKGLSYLKDASALNPNDIVLPSKIKFLVAHLEELKENRFRNAENPTGNKTILVVDDSPTVRKLISGKLEKCGHSVLAAVDGMDALAKINEVIPDLILLDITMPRLDGYQVCKLIRNNEMTKDVPIIMISGKDGFFDKVRGRMAGSSGYITKPFGPDTLMKTIETYLG